MKEHDATETAYKNGYKQGVEDFAERLKRYYRSLNGKTLGASVEYYIDIVAEEMRYGK